jgi:hypothetical protein
MPAGSRAGLIALVYDNRLIRFAGKESSKAMRWRVLWECAVAPGVPRRSLAAALVVGTILNLINQGDALFAGRALDWAKVALTYIVPYCVATYGAVAFRLEAMRRERPAARD